MEVQATLNRPEEPAPLLDKTFNAGIKIGMRGWSATNPNQHGPLYVYWAKGHAGPLYWAVLTALLMG
jgi:hypothetical protein